MSDEIEIEPLEAYLRGRLPDCDGLRVKKLRRTPGGMSRQTWFADVEWGPASAPQEQRLTIRIDHDTGSVISTPLVYEYRVMAALFGSAVPVAEPLWFEDDPSWFGKPFYVRDCVAGDAAPKRLFAEGNEQLRERVGRRLVELMADLHTLDWRERGFPDFMPVPDSPTEAALLELERWRTMWRETAVEPQPALAELFAWLERNAPKAIPRVSVVWGDVGVGNFIYTDDVVALTDWEQAHLGDPMKDIAAALWRGLESLISKDDLYEVYEARSGLKILQKNVDYYDVFIDAQYTATSGSVMSYFTPESVPDITFARLGLGISYRCLDLGLRAIER
jgi:aminoglycoside phosphotransferase (APT) family kinase protein